MAIIQTNCAQVGRYLHVFESIEDSILVLDKLFFSSTMSAKGCGDYQIFCDWLYNSFKDQNNMENVVLYDLTIKKTIEYMFFFKKGGTGNNRRLTTTNNCGEYGQVCEFLDSYEDYEDSPDMNQKYSNQSRTRIPSDTDYNIDLINKN